MTSRTRTRWTGTIKVGAVFLANIDDDNSHCHWTENDDQIALCNDAADEVINGEDDALDLARLKTRPVADATDDMTANVNVDTLESDRSRAPLLPHRTGPDGPEGLGAGTTFTASQIAPASSSRSRRRTSSATARPGTAVNVRFTINTRLGPSSDTVRMRVAPVMTYHHLLPAEEVWVSNTQRPGNAVMRTDLRQACVASGLPSRRR